MVKHPSQCQANGCHAAGIKQNSVISSECLKIGVLQRNGRSRRKPLETGLRELRTGREGGRSATGWKNSS